MSTRRARIKAVTSLPQRRKNAPKVESKVEEQLNSDREKESNSPRVLQSSEGVDSSPVRKVQTPVRARRTPVITSAEKVSEPVRVVTPIPEKRNTPKQPEKVSVITSASNLRSLIFSPPSKRSPVRKHVPSPVRNAKLLADSAEKLSATKETVTKTNDQSKGKDTPNVNKDKTVPENVEFDKVVEKTPNVPDDYQVPSVPESIIDDPMDGIVPLQPITTHKPIAILKNEIISENAEVLFDPIVPLPSPSKVRPKLRPAPRLAPLRRNSVQGSASESEDESRRALLNIGNATPSTARQRHDSQTSLTNREISRIRNDSICSSVSQTTASQAPATSPVKEKVKSRRQEVSRKMAALRRRRETLKRDGLTMYDLIFYNPLSKPFIPDKDEADAKETNDREAAKELENEEDSAEDDAQDAAPVPQIKLGPDGKIILDEQSLVIKQSAKRPAHAHAGACAGAQPYRRSRRTAEWADAETVRFYRALAAIGTDFTLMEPLFPGRTRRDLKLKFKKEEKLNIAQVDKAIRSEVEWDACRLIDEFAEERAEEARREQKKRELLQKEKKEQQERKRAAKEFRIKQSRSAKIMGTSIMSVSLNQDLNIPTTADELIAHATQNKKQRKRKPKDPVVPEPSAKKVLAKTPIPQNPTPPLSKLALIKNTVNPQSPKLADILPRIAAKPVTPMEPQSSALAVPPNVENGSLVVLTVNDPNSPTKKMLQTYIARGAGRLTPVNLPSTLLNSVVGYVTRTSQKSGSARSSPLLTSPSSVASHDSKAPSTPGLVQINPSPSKQKHSSYSITPL
ncbi:hypothetical protein O3G_MSEX006185 [Manduca sexta]|uniref:Transcription factor TFIIIB component B'' Myb domain-containing protein n=1 Tax=Manduca sexta TaxID=7130 RepID=A0A921Z1Q9_MANSE|nr:hypothetical protein O3G_MSEX006185 [Manduca sexta]